MPRDLYMNAIVSRVLLMLGAVCALLGATAMGWAQTSDALYRSSSLGPYPPNLGYGASGPMMMLTASKDHTLFSPIYTDYEDIDGDGVDDYTFKPTFRYYGYFDAAKCYSYNATWSFSGAGGAGRFEPVVKASVTSGRWVCPAGRGYWSGNFLNWATMTRIDVVRKTLYGGFRRQDTSDDTTLEMAQMSHDAHSFVKYYSGSDVGDYTPFDATRDLKGAGITLCSRGSSGFDPNAVDPGYPMIRVARGNYSLWATTPSTVCNWQSEQPYFAFGEKVRAFYAKYGPTQGQGTDPTAHRTQLPDFDVDGLRGGSGGPEFAVRVQACASGMTEGERCQAYSDGSTTVYKPIGLLQEFGSSFDALKASRAEFGLITGSYDSNLRGGALRKNVGSINDEIDRKTGRFCHNIASSRPAECVQANGTLRAEGIIKSFDRIRLYDAGAYNQTAANTDGFVIPREITNGQFASWGNPMSEMVVQALAYFAGKSDLLQPSSVSRDSAVGLPVNVAPIDPLKNSSLDTATQQPRGTLYGKGICRPMHVLAISSGSVSFDAPGGADGDVYGVASYFLNANGQSDTLDRLTDTIGDANHEKVNGTLRSVGSATRDFGTDCTAKSIGTGQGVGQAYSPGLAAVAGICPEAPAVKGSYVGAGAAFMANTHAIRNLGAGSATVAGLNSDTGLDVLPSRLPAAALRVKTYAASLAGGVARIEIPVGNTGRKVYITPESTWYHGRSGADLMPGAMLTFRALYAGPAAGSRNPSGAYVVTWNDTQFGGDYDMDLVGFLRWELSPVAGSDEYELTVLTDVLGHEAGASGSHGFSIIGAVTPAPGSAYLGDGRYLTHGSNDYDKTSRCSALAKTSDDYQLDCRFTDGGLPQSSGGGDAFAWPTSFKGGTGNVGFVDQVGSGAVRYTTTVASKFRIKGGADAVTLRDPLWYMAKYGSFDTGEKAFALGTTASPALSDPANRQPTNWDAENNSGVACGGTVTCADGEPDGYFLARRPELLEARLRQLLDRISQKNSTTPALSSSQLIAGGVKFITDFNPDGFSGDVKAYGLGTDGQFLSTPSASANASLVAVGASRQVITDDGGTGLNFTWGVGISATLTPSYVQALVGATQATTAAQNDFAEQLMAYMRGANNSGGGVFRPRGEDKVLGPIVNSAPWLQDTQSAARYTDADFPSGTASYRAYTLSKASRDSVLWVGANDGMLHGFKATDLTPVLSYVPSALVSRLAGALSVTNTSAVSLMDGSPFTADVLAPTGAVSATGARSNAWRTYLFSPLGRGGRAIFALDVTDGLTAENAASIFKWVFTASDDADLGYSLVPPVRHNSSGQASQVVYLNNQKFAVLVPNGHGSANGLAALFVLYVDGYGSNSTRWKDSAGQPLGYRKLVAQASDSNNGMMGVTWVDLDNNGTADVVYATDLKGQVWKFDIRSSNPADWRSALLSGSTSVPLFTATGRTGAALPITTAPVTSFPSFGGTMVSFGTGRAIESSDFPDMTAPQRFFSVWDKGRYAEDQIFPVPTGVDPPPVPNPLPSLAATRNQTVTSTNADGTTATATAAVPTFLRRVLRRSSEGFVYQVATNANGDPVDAQGRATTDLSQEVPLLAGAASVPFDPNVHDGWYFDFPDVGEAVLSSPVARQNFLTFTSVRPLTSATAAQSCSNAPLGTLYGFNPVSGLAVSGLLKTYIVRDAATGKDLAISTVGNDIGNDQGGIMVRDTTELPKECNADGQCKDVPRCAAGRVPSRFVANNSDVNGCVPANDLRIQWREIPGMKTR